MEKEKVLDKVQKLLALSNSSNDHEALLALMKAQELLAKHNLSMADVPSELKEERVVEEWVMDVSAYNYWVRKLAKIVAQNFRCEDLIYRKPHNKSFLREGFVGLETDAKVAAQIFRYSAKYAERAGSNLAQTYNDKGLSCAGIRQDYIDGFISGLRDGWAKQVLEGTEEVSSEQFARMLVTPVVVKRYMDENTHTISIGTGFQVGAGNEAAFNSGYDSGLAFADLDGKKRIGGV